jgi:rhodanese-related sulfurtransferase
MHKRLLFAALTIALLTVAACSSQATGSAPVEAPAAPRNADGYVDIDVDQLVDKMETQDLTLINVHIPYEGDLPDTDLSIPFDEISAHLDKLPDKDAPIVLYCRSGSMSTSAAKELAELGYTNIMELDGGIRAWTAAGRELVFE